MALYSEPVEGRALRWEIGGGTERDALSRRREGGRWFSSSLPGGGDGERMMYGAVLEMRLSDVMVMKIRPS